MSDLHNWALDMYSWNLITDDFKEACDGLEIGELVKEPNFGLFEAMSAIELMDPKMDAGMLSNQSHAKIKSVNQAIEENLIKIDDLTPEEKIAIVDNTLCHLTTWLDGASLAQTLFTNLYFHDPSVIKDAYMKQFTIAMLKIVDSMRNKIQAAAVFEEEDFQPMNYNFKFCQEIADSVVLSDLKAVEDACAKSYRHLKGEKCVEEANKDSQQLKLNLSHALWMRIKFVRNLFQLMQNTNEHQYFAKNTEDIVKYINNCKDALSKFEETNKLGTQPELVKFGKTVYPIVMGFEPCINQRLLPPTFPRFIRIHTFDITCKSLNEMLTELNRALQVLQIGTFHQLFEFCLDFSDNNQSLLLRSLLQLIILPRPPMDKLLKAKELLRETVNAFIAPPAMQPKCFLHSKEITPQLVENFLNKCSPVFITALQILGNNKARQREKLGHFLEDLANLQEEADNVDRILHSILLQHKSNLNHLACFGSWILYNTLTVMNLYLVAGFELELYSKYEYHYVHWYICEIILNWQINTLNRTESFLVSAEQNFSAVPAKKKSNKKKMKHFYEKEISILTANRHMHSAFYQAMRAFQLKDYIKSPNAEFDCEEFRYNHRFSPFQCFNTPTICMYHQYKEKDDQFVNSFELNKIYSFAQEHFDLARQIYEKYSSECPLASQIKISKTNFVVMRLLSSGLKKADKLELDNASHMHFPIVRI